MVRIAGTDLPRAKRVEYALTKIYGIGVVSSQEILAKANVDPNARTNDLTDENVSSIRQVIESEYKVEGDLRRKISLVIFVQTFRCLALYALHPGSCACSPHSRSPEDPCNSPPIASPRANIQNVKGAALGN